MKEIKIEDKNYPNALYNIKNTPATLYAEGNINILNYKPCITIVGSRNMSEYGMKITKNIVKELVNYNICIVSGMAVGIDAVAHDTCIRNGGKTIAVLGCGLNRIFPPENIGLFHKIVNSGGCVITEYPGDTIAQKQFFPLRNRIVSGLSMATVVIEATYRSGTSITAKFAFEQKKEVYCIPNGIGSKNSAGTINLLKKGAKIVTCAEDILVDLGIIKKEANNVDREILLKEKKIEILESNKLKELDSITQKVYYMIKENKIINSERLSTNLMLSISEINMHLSILELSGLIVENGVMNFEISDKFII